MDETQQYSAAEMERMMKVQDVLLKAVASDLPPEISTRDNLESPVMERGFSNEEDEA